MFRQVFWHRFMLADPVRMTAYRRAIHAIVQRDDVVVDLGTGSGILGFFALQAGARKVYAVEEGDILEEARRLAKANRLEEKIVFLKGISERIELPEKADVLISEILGHFGLEENVVRFVDDARARFLKPEGKVIPGWLELFLAPVTSETIWKQMIGFWEDRCYGVDLSPVKAYAASQKLLLDCSKNVDWLAPPVVVAHIDFRTGEKRPLQFQADFLIEKKGTLHGLVGYFEAGLSPEIVLSNSPERGPTSWQHTFFPMENPVAVKEGDKAHHTITAIPLGQQFFWQWETEISRGGTGITKFSQSDLFIPKDQLSLGRKTVKPILNAKGQLHRDALELCDGSRTLDEMSDLLYDRYREEFRTKKKVTETLVDILLGKVKMDGTR